MEEQNPFTSSEGNCLCLSSSDSSVSDSLSLLRDMQLNGELCDVVLTTESGESISAHRVILAASSPFFKGLFATNLAEKDQQVVLLKEIDFDILKAVVASTYNAEISIPKDQVKSLLMAADLFQMRHIFDMCCKYLASQITPHNCLSLGAFADFHNCKTLHNLCTKFASEHFEEVISCDEFLLLPCNQLKDLICRDDIQVSSEEVVYNSVLQWVYHDLETRQEMFTSIMSHVRLPFVSTEFLSSSVKQEHLMLSEDGCQGYIQEAILYKSSPEKRPTLRNSPRAKPRKPCGLQDVILTAGGMGRGGPLSLIEQFEMRTDTWSNLAEMDLACYGLAACILNGCLYATGGFSSVSGLLNSVQCYNLKEKKWKLVEPMKHPRRYHCSGTLYGLLYTAGGLNSDGVISSVERYDPVTDTWMFVQPMRDARMYHGLAEMDGFLFSIGGHNGQSRLKSVEFYDPAQDLWQFACSLTSPRSVAGVAKLGSSIYIAGGYDGKHYLNSVECYDIELNRWLPCPSLGTSRSAFGLVGCNGSLYACGGFNGSFLNSVEQLVLGSNEWESVMSMETSKVHFGTSCT